MQTITKSIVQGALIMSKKVLNLLYWGAMALLLIWFAYTKGWIFADFESISPKQALERIEKNPDTPIIDVRTPKEFQKGHLVDATLIPLDRLEANLNKLAAFKNQPILVYCRSGSRSVEASRILKKHGFTPLNIKNGIIGLIGAHATIVKAP